MEDFIRKFCKSALTGGMAWLRTRNPGPDGIQNEMKKYELNPFVIQHYNRTFAARLSDLKCLI